MKTIVKAILLSACLALAVGQASAKPGNGNSGNSSGNGGGNSGNGGGNGGNSGGNNGNGANPGPGASTASDVTLGGAAAGSYALVQHGEINPIQSTAGFDTQFSGAGTSVWTQAQTVESSNSNVLTLTDKLSSDSLTFSFTQASGGTSGTWSVTNTNAQNTTLDLVLSFHAGNNVGSFLFDNQSIAAGQTLNGDWQIQWLNNAGNSQSVPTFSNMAFYTGSVQFTSAVPEPSTYAMMLGGFGLMGFIARRRRRQA